MNGQYGLSHFWQQGDAITHLVALILLLMSVLTWVVLIYKVTRFWQTRKHSRQPSSNRSPRP